MKKALIFIGFIFSVSFLFAQQGWHMQMKFSTTTDTGTTYIYIYFHSNLGSRTEMNIPALGKSGGEEKIIFINKKEMPEVSFTLFEQNMIYYKEMKTDTTNDKDEYIVKLLGVEPLNGYKCTRSLVTAKNKSFEIWTTREINNSYCNFFNNRFEWCSSKMNAALKDADCDGFAIKIIKKGNVLLDTDTFEVTKFDAIIPAAELFEIPAGYTKKVSHLPKTFDIANPPAEEFIEE